MNISKIEPPWSRELTEYMEERYGIDIDELICEAILECEDAELQVETNVNSIALKRLSCHESK